MTHYRLGTDLPPRPVAPGRPALALPLLWARCREELDARTVSAVEALFALDEAELEAGGAEAVAGWRARVERAQQRAQEAGSELLQEWVAYEHGLREALAARRAEGLGRPWPAPPPEVESRAAALGPEVARIMAGADPAQRQRALDAARLQQLDRLAGIDPFDTDAVLAQVVAARVVQRWDFDDDQGDAALQEVWT